MNNSDPTTTIQDTVVNRIHEKMKKKKSSIFWGLPVILERFTPSTEDAHDSNKHHLIQLT